MRPFVTSISPCACESWTLTAELQRRIQAIEIRCCHKILRISYTDCHQLGSPCQDPAGNRTTRRPETQTAVVWSCLPFIRPCQNHLAGHSERGEKTRQTEKETTSGNGQALSSPAHRGQWRTGGNGGNWLRNHLLCPNNPRG